MGFKQNKKKDSSSKHVDQTVQNENKDVKEKRYQPVKGWKLWMFRLCAVVIIPLFLFIVLEAGLRLTGFGYPTSLAIRYKDGNVDKYYSNIKFSWLFFDPKISRDIDPFMFPVKKDENTYRIFIMGASAAAGTPDGAYSFGRSLQVMLRLQYPETNFEVITAAMPAINSHAILRIAKDCADYDPDMYIVYLGNNEVVGPYGAGTVFASMNDNISLIRFGIGLKTTRVGQLIAKITRTIDNGSPKVWLGMEMFLDKQVRKDSPQMKAVYRNYERNLNDICNVAIKNEIPMICSTVGSNLKDNPPFASEHSLGLSDSKKQQWDELYQEGIGYENDGDYSSAVDIYLKAAQIDSDFADLQFRLGRCYWEMENYEKSKERFVLARELDTLRFRADNQINSIIRDVAGEKSEKGIYLVDAYKVFEDNSPHNITGKELFHEHVHLNFTGNYLLAKTIFKQVQEILPESIKKNSLSAKHKATSFPSEKEVARYLAYTDWEKHRIAKKVVDEYLKEPPFNNQLYHEDKINKAEQKVKALQDALTEDVMEEVEKQNLWAIEQTPSDFWLYWKYGLLLENQEKFPEAITQYQEVIKIQPINYGAYAKLGLLYGYIGNTRAAIENNFKAIELYPYSAIVYFNMAVTYQLQYRSDKAIEYYKKAISLNPKQADIYYNLALVLYNQLNVKEAIDIFREGLKYSPDDLSLLHGLGVILKAENRTDEAIEVFKAALNIDPNYVGARNELNSLLN